MVLSYSLCGHHNTGTALIKYTSLATSPSYTNYQTLFSQAREGSNDKDFKYRLPDPASRKDIEYYRDPAHRGYLSYQVAAGHGPSLFFKTPGTGTVKKKLVKRRLGRIGFGKGV